MTGADGKHSKSYSEDEIQSLEIFHNQIEYVISLDPKPKNTSKLEQKIIDLEKRQKEQTITQYQDEFFAKNQQKQMEKVLQDMADMKSEMENMKS